MQLKAAAIKIKVPEDAVISWPVEIRVGAHARLKARRKPAMLPERATHEKHAQKLLRTIELPGTRPCRQAPGEFELLMAIDQQVAQHG